MPRVADVKKAQALQLAKMLAGNDPTAAKADKYQAISPDAAAYNNYGPIYAQSLGMPLKGPQDAPYLAADILNQRALGANADLEAERYRQDLAAANEAQGYLQHQASVEGRRDQVLASDLKNNDLVGTIAIDANGDPVYDNKSIGQYNAEVMSGLTADRVQKVGAGVKDLATVDYRPTDAYISSAIAPSGLQNPEPVADTAVTVDMGHGIPPVVMTQEDAVKYYDAIRRGDAAMVAALASQYRAHHPSNTGIKTVISTGPGGGKTVAVTYPGVVDPPDNPSGYIGNPKAGAHGSGASAKPSAASITTPNNDAEVRAIGSRYGTVTSTTRSKEHNKEVGGVNNSFHVDYGHGGHAIDLVPHKGVTKEQVAEDFRGRGYTVYEALNEGDHLHFAIAKNGGTASAAAQPRPPVSGGLDRIVQTAQAKGYPHQVTSDGIVVQFPNGHQVLYGSNGDKRRIK